MGGKDELQKLWTEHQAVSFPLGHRGIQVDGSSLTLIESDIVAAVMAYLDTGKSLMPHRAESLRIANERLVKCLGLVKPEARPYFTRLKMMGDLTLAEQGGSGIRA